MKSRITPALVLLLASASAACSARAGSDFVPETSAALRALHGVDSLSVQTLAPGVLYARAWDRSGPWAIHVVEIDTARCAPLWESRKPAGLLSARATTSALAAGALATINADFFQLPGGTPVGAQVHDGVALIGPGDRAVWLWDGQRMSNAPAALVGSVASGSDSVPLLQLDRGLNATSAYRPRFRGAAIFGARVARVPPADSAADVAIITLSRGDESSGEGTIRSLQVMGRDTIAIEAGTVVLQLFGPERAWAARRKAGDAVRWHSRLTPVGQSWSAREAVGGFPIMLRDARDVLSETRLNASFSEQRHPRSAIGWSSALGRVFLVLVDGRQAPYSDGMTLPELTRFFQKLGATDALNLDGGGSSAIVLRGAVQNRPSDKEGERAVGNALALAACRSTRR